MTGMPAVTALQTADGMGSVLDICKLARVYPFLFPYYLLVYC